MSGLVAPPAAAAPGSGGDVWAEIGGLYEQKAFQRRIDALTDPGAYAIKRTGALDAIKKAAEDAYKTAYAGYISAGLSPEMAKINATNSARSEYHNQQSVFNLEYGQGTDQIFQGSAANKGTMGTQGTLAGAAPRARARRAPARRSSTTSTAASRSAAAKRGAATKRRLAKKRK